MIIKNEHIVSAYDDELGELDGKLATMGDLTEKLLAASMRALSQRDPDLASQTIRQDREIDRLEREVEDLAIRMIARRQPLAQDLRQIMAAIRISTDLERVGDLGKNIAKRALAVSSETHPESLLRGFEHMGEMALRQLTDVLESYMRRDAGKALAVWHKDEEIDAMYNSLFSDLLAYMMEDQRTIGLCTHLLFGAKNIERIGDHATNIAETVCYLVNGEPIEGERPKLDVTSQTPVAGTPLQQN